MTINAHYYVNNILQQILLPVLGRKSKSGPIATRKMFNRCLELVFVQYGAPAHTAWLTQQWCSDHVPGFLHNQEWPPNSTDLNQIENCLGILNSRLFLSPLPTTIKLLNSRATKEWDQSEPPVHSMHQRLEAVIRMKGTHTGF